MCGPKKKNNITKNICFLLLNWAYLFPKLLLFLRFSKMTFLFGGHAKACQNRNACFVAHSAWHVTTYKSHVLAIFGFIFSVGVHYTRIFRNQRVANSSASKLQPAMVDISYRCQITYQEEKPVSIAADLVEEHQGQKFLKISATNYAICQLVCGGKLPTKNPSLAKSKELQALVQARNDKIQEYLAAPEETQELFDSEMPKNKCTKKEKPKPWKNQVTSLWSPSYWVPLRFHVWLVAKDQPSGICLLPWRQNPWGKSFTIWELVAKLPLPNPAEVTRPPRKNQATGDHSSGGNKKRSCSQGLQKPLFGLKSTKNKVTKSHSWPLLK